MKKDFITVTPDSGKGSSTVTVAAEKNVGNARNTSLIISGGSINRTIQITQEVGKVDFVELLSGKAIFNQRSDGGYVEINQNAGTELLTVEKDGAKLRYQSSKDAGDLYEGEYYFADTDNLDIIAKQMGYDFAAEIPFCVYRVKMRLYKGYCIGYFFKIRTSEGTSYELGIGSGTENFKLVVLASNGETVGEGQTVSFGSSKYLDLKVYVVSVNSEITNGVVPDPWKPGINFLVEIENTLNLALNLTTQEGSGEILITPDVMADNTGEYQCLIYNPGTDLGGAEIPIAIIDDPSFNRMYFTNKNPVLGEELPE